jgi:hypothetical protein
LGYTFTFARILSPGSGFLGPDMILVCVSSFPFEGLNGVKLNLKLVFGSAGLFSLVSVILVVIFVLAFKESGRDTRDLE